MIKVFLILLTGLPLKMEKALNEYRKFVRNMQSYKIKLIPHLKIEKGNPTVKSGYKMHFFNWKNCLRFNTTAGIWDPEFDPEEIAVKITILKSTFWWPASILEANTEPKSFSFNIDYSSMIAADIKAPTTSQLRQHPEGNYSTYWVHLYNLYPDSASRVMIGQIDSVASEVTDQIWDRIVQTLDAVVPGGGSAIAEITDMVIQTECDWGDWPNSIPAFISELYPLWGGKDTMRIQLPGLSLPMPFPVTSLLQAPEAPVLYILTPTFFQSTVGVPIGLDGVYCAYLTGTGFFHLIQKYIHTTILPAGWDSVLDSIPLLQYAKMYTNGCWGVCFPLIATQLTSSDYQATANEVIKGVYIFFSISYPLIEDSLNIPGIGPITRPAGWKIFAERKEKYNLQRYYPRIYRTGLGKCVRIGEPVYLWEGNIAPPHNRQYDLSEIGYVLWKKYNCRTKLILKLKLNPTDNPVKK